MVTQDKRKRFKKKDVDNIKKVSEGLGDEKARIFANNLISDNDKIKTVSNTVPVPPPVATRPSIGQPTGDPLSNAAATAAQAPTTPIQAPTTPIQAPGEIIAPTPIQAPGEVRPITETTLEGGVDPIKAINIKDKFEKLPEEQKQFLRDNFQPTDRAGVVNQIDTFFKENRDRIVSNQPIQTTQVGGQLTPQQSKDISSKFTSLAPDEKRRVTQAFQAGKTNQEVVNMIMQGAVDTPKEAPIQTGIDRAPRIEAGEGEQGRITSLKTDVDLSPSAQSYVASEGLNMGEFRQFLNFDSQKGYLNEINRIENDANLTPEEKGQKIQQTVIAAKEKTDRMKVEENKFKATAGEYNQALQDPEQFSKFMLEEAEEYTQRDIDLTHQVEESTKSLADNTNAIIQEKVGEQSDEARRLFDEFEVNQNNAFNDFRARELVGLVGTARGLARQRGIDIDDVNPSLILADMGLAATDAFNKINDARTLMINTVHQKEQELRGELDRLQNEGVISAIEKDAAYKAAGLATLQNINQIEKEWFNLATQETRTEIDRKQQQEIAGADAIERILTSMGLSEGQKQSVRGKFAGMRPEDVYRAIASDPSIGGLIQEAETQAIAAAQSEREFDAYLESLKAGFKSQLSEQGFQQDAALQAQDLGTKAAIEQAKLEQRQNEATLKANTITPAKPTSLSEQEKLFGSVLGIKGEEQKKFFKDNFSEVVNAIMNQGTSNPGQPLTIPGFGTISATGVDSITKLMADKTGSRLPGSITGATQPPEITGGSTEGFGKVMDTIKNAFNGSTVNQNVVGQETTSTTNNKDDGGYVNEKLQTAGGESIFKKLFIQNQKLANSDVPIPGGVLILDMGNQYGHVAVIEDVYDSGVMKISETDYDDKGGQREVFVKVLPNSDAVMMSEDGKDWKLYSKKAKLSGYYSPSN